MKTSIQVVVDLVCPWCFIATRKLDLALRQSKRTEDFALEWRPFELDPEMPKSGASRPEYRANRFGSLNTSNEMDQRAKEEGKKHGIEFRYDLMNRTPNTMAAHRLVWLAGKEGVETQVVDALFSAYFTDGRDIGDLDVLVDVAASVGVPRDRAKVFLAGSEGETEVRALIRQSDEVPVEQVPTFFINQKLQPRGFEFVQSLIRQQKQ